MPNTPSAQAARAPEWTAGDICGGINNMSLYVVLQRDGQLAAHVFGSNPVQVRERAENVCRAANSHATLVEALEAARDALAGKLDVTGIPTALIVAKIDAALASARP